MKARNYWKNPINLRICLGVFGTFRVDKKSVTFFLVWLHTFVDDYVTYKSLFFQSKITVTWSKLKLAFYIQTNIAFKLLRIS